jgi:hypothetical protein
LFAGLTQALRSQSFGKVKGCTQVVAGVLSTLTRLVTELKATFTALEASLKLDASKPKLPA